MNELSLFTGIGGGILGSVLLGWRTICAVEKDSYCREVLLRRQADRLLPVFPIWEDVRTFDGKEWRGVVDIITAGFPCQPFSVAGKRKGEADERNMWPDTIRIIREVRPRYALLENVPGLLATRYFGRILGDISESGYDAEWEVISAADVGAPHLRKRLWILLSDTDSSRGRIQQEPRREFENQANIDNDGEKKFMANAARARSGELYEGQGREGERTFNAHGACEDVAHTQVNRWNPWGQDNAEEIKRGWKSDRSSFSENMGDSNSSGRVEQWGTEPAQSKQQAPECTSWWEFEPDVGRVVDGVSFRVDQLRGLGNAQVPRVVEKAWQILRGE